MLDPTNMNNDLWKTNLRLTWEIVMRDHISDRVNVNLFQNLVNEFIKNDLPYHNGSHTVQVLSLCEMLCGEYDIDKKAQNILRIAAIFHDIIYDVHNHDNEERSADYMRRFLSPLNIENDILYETERLIMCTKHNSMCEVNDVRGQILCDADLSILGTSKQCYLDYSIAIRNEYHHIEDNIYKNGRIAVLNNFLSRQSIYQTHIMKRLFEQQAIQNIENEILSLKS